MWRNLRTAIVFLLLMSALTGIAYPLATTGAAQLLFPHQANGSLIMHDSRAVGSELIGQRFDDPRYFWSRPSATGPMPYNAGASSGSNLSIGNPAQVSAMESRLQALRLADPENKLPVPGDLLTASGSGLDPHISPAGAEFQAARVARLRGLTLQRVRELIAAATEHRQFGLLGEPRVNVLRLNLLLAASGKENS